MKVQITYLSLVLMLMSSANAAPVFTLSGDRFVELMRALEESKPDGYAQRERAYAYLDGVRDTSSGKSWCDRHAAKTPDLAYAFAAAISKLPPSERKKNAALLLTEQLRHAYPCDSPGGPR